MNMIDPLCDWEEVLNNRSHTGPIHLYDEILDDRDFIKRLMDITLLVDPTAQTLMFRPNGDIDEEAMLAFCHGNTPDQDPLSADRVHQLYINLPVIQYHAMLT